MEICRWYSYFCRTICWLLWLGLILMIMVYGFSTKMGFWVVLIVPVRMFEVEMRSMRIGGSKLVVSVLLSCLLVPSMYLRGFFIMLNWVFWMRFFILPSS